MLGLVPVQLWKSTNGGEFSTINHEKNSNKS